MDWSGKASRPQSSSYDDRHYRECLDKDASRLFKERKNGQLDLLYTTTQSAGSCTNVDMNHGGALYLTLIQAHLNHQSRHRVAEYYRLS